MQGLSTRTKACAVLMAPDLYDQGLRILTNEPTKGKEARSTKRSPILYLDRTNLYEFFGCRIGGSAWFHAAIGIVIRSGLNSVSALPALPARVIDLNRYSKEIVQNHHQTGPVDR